MGYSKRFFSVVAMVLCFSIFVGAVSHAASIKYKETKLSSPIAGLKNTRDAWLEINSTGKIQLNMYDYRTESDSKVSSKKCAYVTYSSSGKKQVKKSLTTEKLVFGPFGPNMDIEFYGNYVYIIKNKKLIVYTKKGKKVKTIKLDVSKYLKKKTDKVTFEIAEITGENKVMLYYMNVNWTPPVTGYGGMVEVNTTTKKIKRLVATDFIPSRYDGKYIYAYETNSEKITFYQKSIKTKKTKKFVADKIIFDEREYSDSYAVYSYYNGKVMGLSPTGAVYYGTFENEKFEQIGDISDSANFKKYDPLSFVMKSKDEFYILYAPNMKKGEENERPYEKVFVAKYKK